MYNKEILNELENKYYNLSNDQAFKYAFTNKKFLSKFLSVMWNKDVKASDISIIDSKVNAQGIHNKQIAVDVNGVVKDGTIKVFLNLEMQKRKPKGYDMHDRIFYYFSRDKALSVSIGESYSSSRVECILFTDYEPDNDGWKNEIRVKNIYDDSYYISDRIIVIQLKNIDDCHIIELKELLLGFKTKESPLNNKTTLGKEVQKMLDDINRNAWLKNKLIKAEYDEALRKKYEAEEKKKLIEEVRKDAEAKVEEAQQATKEAQQATKKAQQLAEAKVEEAQQATKEAQQATKKAQQLEKSKIDAIKNLYSNGCTLELISTSYNMDVEEVKRIIEL